MLTSLSDRPDINTLDVEGFTAADPIENEDDWEDCIGWQIRVWWMDRRDHDQDGYLCEMAGSAECLALGHKPNPGQAGDGDEWDNGEHQLGWGGDWICPETKYATACTQCESEDCGGWKPFDPEALWSAVRA